MAVKPARKTITDYRKHYRRSVIFLIATSQVLSLIGLTTVLLSIEPTGWWRPLFWVGILLSFIFDIVVLLFLVQFIASPFYSVLSAIMYRSGELTTYTPPSPNHKNNLKTGLATVLQSIYDMDSDTKSDTDTVILDAPLTTEEALSHMKSGIVILDDEKRVVGVGGGAPIKHSTEGERFLALDFMDDESLASWLAGMDHKSITGERRWQRVTSGLEGDNRIFDVIAYYEKGSEAETVIILIDQTEHYSPDEEDLNFIAFAAHELRGPITVIRGYLSIVEDELSDRLKGDEAELINRMKVSASRLSSYVNNILNVARYDQKHLRVQLGEDSIGQIYSTVADDLQMRAAAQYRLLSVTIPDNLPTVAADRNSIGEVISNLVDNAIKYSFEGGSIAINARTSGDFVEVSVSDNGIGMPSGVVNNLFKKFYRSHRSREATAGTGIGLYICRAFVESHGGSISVNSRENEGSTFVFTLPIYSTVADKLLGDEQLNQGLIHRSGGWIKNHSMYRG